MTWRGFLHGTALVFVVPARFIAKLLRDIFYKPGTRRLSLGRLIFLLIGALIAYTVLARNIIFSQLTTMELALLPYMWLDKQRPFLHGEHTPAQEDGGGDDNDAGGASSGNEPEA